VPRADNLVTFLCLRRLELSGPIYVSRGVALPFAFTPYFGTIVLIYFMKIVGS
jgi:hypothetical protein